MIAIIDYRAGNLTSVARALQYLAEPCEITGDPRKLQEAERIIFPGVGAAGEAMGNLRAGGLDACIREAFQAGKPILGICLGTQVIFDYSEEDEAACLGIVRGQVRRFPGDLRQNGKPLKIPHMGWNRLRIERPAPILAGLPDEPFFYFVHSYYVVPTGVDVTAATTEYGTRFTSVIWRDNLFATQFHPEKSQGAGLALLKNFAALAR